MRISSSTHMLSHCQLLLGTVIQLEECHDGATQRSVDEQCEDDVARDVDGHLSAHALQGTTKACQGVANRFKAGTGNVVSKSTGAEPSCRDSVSECSRANAGTKDGLLHDDSPVAAGTVKLLAGHQPRAQECIVLD